MSLRKITIDSWTQSDPSLVILWQSMLERWRFHDFKSKWGIGNAARIDCHSFSDKNSRFSLRFARKTSQIPASFIRSFFVRKLSWNSTIKQELFFEKLYYILLIRIYNWPLTTEHSPLKNIIHNWPLIEALAEIPDVSGFTTDKSGPLKNVVLCSGKQPIRLCDALNSAMPSFVS